MEVAMIYCVMFEDNEEFAGARAEKMSMHLEFLNKNATVIHAAGPLFDAMTKTSAGGLWIVETDSIEDVLDYIKLDPFWSTGLRKSYRILEWRQVFNSRI
jgi:uncharacterized protein